MKKLDVHSVDWDAIQKKHNEGVALSKLGISRNMIFLGIEAGLFTKRKTFHKWSETEKRMLSEKRKSWMNKNPDKHPWRKKSKFVSIPCEQLKVYLRSLGMHFEEEAVVSNERNYSVDILFPQRNLILEINGNQHYDKEGKLTPYYQERHDHITSLGWKVVELHYTIAYNHDLVRNIILDESVCSSVLPFKLQKKTNKSTKTSRKDAGAIRSNKWVSENTKMVSLVLESDIDFSKFGWVVEVSKIIGKKPQKVNSWMKRIMPDFYEEKCYKRKSVL